MTIAKQLVTIGVALAALLLIGGVACAPRYADTGDTVTVHYTGTTSDGEQFDSSVGGDPLEFVLGQPGMIPGFERALYGMKVGETKTVTIPAADAYGPVDQKLVMEIDLDEFPGGSPEIGQQIQISFSNGSLGIAVVTGVSGTTVTVDANHFLAGQDLTFEITLVNVR